MATFFTGAFTRELRRRIRRDLIEHAPRHLHHDVFNRGRDVSTLIGLGTRRLLANRNRLQAKSAPQSQTIGSRGSNYNTNGNRSRNSGGRTGNSSGTNQSTTGTRGTTGSSRTQRTGRTGRTRPTRVQRFSGAASAGRRRNTAGAS